MVINGVNIVPYKHYNEYTDRELMALPELNVPEDVKEEYIFDGFTWIHDDLNY